MRSISKRRPQWPFRINWDCPQAEGLECLISFINTRGVILTKGGGFGLGVPTNTNRFRYNNIGETGVDFNTTDTNGITFPYSDAPFITSAGCSIIWSGIIDGSTGGNQQLVGKYVLPGTTTTPFSFYYSNSTSRLAMIRAGATSFVEHSGQIISSLLGQYSTFGITVNNTPISGASVTYTSYVNGSKTIMGLSFGSSTENVSGSNADIHIGHIAGIAQLDGYCAHILFYNKCISDVAMAAASDPVTQWDIYWKSDRWTLFDIAAVSASPFYQTEWPNPNLGKLNNLGFSGNPILFQTLSAPLQNKQTEWPNPLIAKRPHVGHIDYDTFIDSNVKPIGKDSFPSRIEKKERGKDWIQPRPLYYQDDKPFKQDAWPNPELRLKSEKGHIHNRKLDEPPTPEPFKVPNYPNPLLKKRINPSWTDNFSLEETFTRPVASSTFDNPVPKKKGETLTWIQPRAFFYEEPAVIVFRQNSWPNPFIRKGLQGIINRHFIDSGVTVSPFNQNNWPLPLRKRIHPKWEDNYVLDDNVPFTQLSFILPLRKSNFTPTWINPGILITQAGTPIVPYDYPNPIIVKQHTLTWIDNLLQRDLNPGEGEKPFNQNDYPNPLIGLRLLHTGWIDIRKFYFDEPPLQIGQFDWPIFRATVRNATGHIHSQKQDEEPPKFVSVDNLPLVKNVLGITWIDNPLIVITGPVLVKPFNQNDYPNPRLKIPYYNNFNIFRPTSLIPPFIKGRKICLDAGFTIFELEAALEEYEIKARAEDFILNADGEECE